MLSQIPSEYIHLRESQSSKTKNSTEKLNILKFEIFRSHGVTDAGGVCAGVISFLNRTPGICEALRIISVTAQTPPEYTDLRKFH